MKLRTIVKTALITSVVLLCSGFALYSFFKISAVEEQKNFDLYTLVPTSATAVFFTDNVVEFVSEIDGLTSSHDSQYPHVSQLFTYLSQYLNAILNEVPHGLSRQMNQMVISFHEPDNDNNQILYCNLGTGDHELITNFVHKYLSSDFQPKVFNYKGEDIVIYPMEDGGFLACYLTQQYMVLSTQKKLIEEVIDTQKSKESLSKDKAFKAARVPKKSTAIATVYTRFDKIIGWTEFDLKLKDDLIYFTGISQNVDTSSAFVNVLRQQDSIKGFPGGILPASSFYFSRMAVSDWNALLTYTDTQQYALSGRTADISRWDDVFSRFLAENSGSDIISCLFQSNDSLSTPPNALLSISLADVDEAKHMMAGLLQGLAVEKVIEKKSPISVLYADRKSYPVYMLPSTTLFAQLTGFKDYSPNLYITFYANRLLLAPELKSLSQYIAKISKGEVLDEGAVYNSGIDGLSDTYQFMIMADFEHIFKQQGNPVHYIPDFFFRNSDFFHNYTFFAQFVCNNGVVYPNFILKYQPEE